MQAKPSVTDAAPVAEECKTRDDRGRFVKGISGNPGGKPKGAVSLMARLRGVLAEETADGRTRADEMVDLIHQAIKEDPVKAWPILKDFVARDEGPIEQVHRLQVAQEEQRQQDAEVDLALEAYLQRGIESDD